MFDPYPIHYATDHTPFRIINKQLDDAPASSQEHLQPSEEHLTLVLSTGFVTVLKDLCVGFRHRYLL